MVGSAGEIGGWAVTRGGVRVRLGRAKGITTVVAMFELLMNVNRNVERDERRFDSDG